MTQIPLPCSIFPNIESVWVSVYYENVFTTVNDVTHDENHIHDFYEIYVNLQGDVSFLVDDTIYKVHRGDAVISKPNELHRCIYHSDGIHEHFCIWILELPHTSSMVSECLDNNSIISLSADDKEKLIEYCFKLYEAGKQPRCESIYRASSYFGILELICSNHQLPPEEQNLPQNFARIMEYITRHYSEPTFNVKSICDEFFISQSTLLRRFRQYFQTSPSIYIESKRLSKSKQLLFKGYSVQSACFFSGFSDCSYFILRFRKKFGMTPYKYQKIGLELPQMEIPTSMRSRHRRRTVEELKNDPMLREALETEMTPEMEAALKAELLLDSDIPESEILFDAEDNIEESAEN